jgi:hypothetical protein
MPSDEGEGKHSYAHTTKLGHQRHARDLYSNTYPTHHATPQVLVLEVLVDCRKCSLKLQRMIA